MANGVIRFSRDPVARFAAALRRARAAGRARGGARRPFRPPEEGLTTFTVATWNIHSCVGVDARFAPDRVGEILRGLEADLIGLQEVGWHHRGEAGFDQFAYLAKATGMNVLSAPTKDSPRAHFGNALLTRLPVRVAEPIDLSVRRREPRGGLDAVVEVGGRPVRLIVAHLGLDGWERAQQIARVLARLDAEPDLPTLFLGDLNEWNQRSSRLRRLAEAFDDAACPRSFHARLPTLRLDRIYVRGGLTLCGFEAVRNRLSRHASDHLPVRALVSLA